jgi:hypothetical protein
MFHRVPGNGASENESGKDPFYNIGIEHAQDFPDFSTIDPPYANFFYPDLARGYGYAQQAYASDQD